MSLQDWLAVVAALGSLGLFTALAFLVRYSWNVRRWRTFASLVEEWAKTDVHADGVDDGQLRLMTVNWLYEAEFSAKESIELLDFATLFARARVDHVLRELAKP